MYPLFIKCNTQKEVTYLIYNMIGIVNIYTIKAKQRIVRLKPN